MMKKIVCVIMSSFLLGTGTAFAQGMMDAYKFSQYDLTGTARYLGMGGAFGALGGDISAMGTNPAGLGIYRSSEIVTTLSLSAIKTNTNWTGTEMGANKTKFNFDNIAYVGYFPTGNDEGLVSWNVGFAYNRVKNFNRSYKMGRGAGGYSLSDYIAAISNLSGLKGDNLWSTDDYNPYQSQLWLPTLGYNAGLIDAQYPSSPGTFHSPFGYWEDKNWNALEVQQADMTVNERGAINKYDFSLATNISNRFFIGATVSVSDLSYQVNSSYDEDFGSAGEGIPSDHLYLDNYSKVNGTGYAFNLGVIVRPTDFLRLGVAYNSPIWYKMTNYYDAGAGAYVHNYYGDNPSQNPVKPGDPNLDRSATTPTDVYTDFKLRTNDRWIFSAAAILGQYALLSVDYELTNYKSMRLYDRDGYAIDIDNNSIKSDLKTSGMLKIGAEFKVTPQFSVRLGTALQSSPASEQLKYEGKSNDIVEVLTPGTRTMYTVDYHTNYYTVGLGYRFTPNFYMDLAYVYRMQKEDVYPFSNVINPDGDIIVEALPATLKTNTTKVALTLGYKF